MYALLSVNKVKGTSVTEANGVGKRQFFSYVKEVFPSSVFVTCIPFYKLDFNLYTLMTI